MLKETLAKLPENQKKELLLALEQESSHYIVVDTDHYIGVNVNLRSLLPEEVAGNWSYGKIIL